MDSEPGHSVTKGASGKARVGTGRVCLAFGKDWGSKETCSIRGIGMETQRKGRWKNDGFMMYASATREEGDNISRVLASNAVVGEIQPGQGTRWGGGGGRKNY